MAKETSFTLKEKNMKGTGVMTKHRDMEFTLTQTMLDMKESGTKICSMERVQRSGKMGHFLQESIEMGKRMELENTNGEMEPVMKENGKIMKLQGMVTTLGLMEESM